jgi:hypothetical protein
VRLSDDLPVGRAEILRAGVNANREWGTNRGAGGELEHFPKHFRESEGLAVQLALQLAVLAPRRRNGAG